MKDGMLLETVQHPLFEYTDLDVDFDETHVYIVVAVFDDGCERASEPLSVTVLWDAVQENIKEVKVYPNPANNLLHVEGAGLAQVEVFNIMGQSVLRVGENFEAIDISRLQNGIYFVRLKTNDGEKTVKLVVEK